MAQRAHVTTIQPQPWFPVAAPLPPFARDDSREADGLLIQHAPMFYFPGILKSLDSFWLYRSILSKLLLLQRNQELDLIDAHFGYPEGVGAFLAARRLGLPVFVTLRGFEAEYLDKPIIGSQIRYLLRNADGCICVSHFLKKLALDNGARAGSTRVIHNGIDRSVFFPGEQLQARQSLGLPLKAPLVVSVGHLISRKRHHVLIDAFAEVSLHVPKARLLIIGGKSFEANYPGDLHRQVAELGIDGAVSFVGNVKPDQVANYLRAADVFALGTQREGCCNAVLEALACGTPVITTPVGDNPWFIENGRNGLIVPVDDRRAMARSLVEALTSSDWNRDDISAKLGVGNWPRVAEEVLEFMAERLSDRQVAKI